MIKRLIAGLLTVALMGLLLRSGLRAVPSTEDQGDSTTASSEESATTSGPEARIRSLLVDAAAGDVPAYLAGFTPRLRARLEREADEKGRPAFAEALRAAARARKSHAIFVAEADGLDSSRIVVEAVYPDRNERQTYRLERADGGWLIADVDTVRGHRPQARFGTPAAYQEPEGVPVQTNPGNEEPPIE